MWQSPSLLLLSLPRRLTLAEAITAVVFAAFGFRYIRLTPLVFLATAPMLAARLTVWTTRGVDGRAMLATALAAAVFVSRVPLTTMVGGVRVGGAHPEVIFSAGALAFARTHGLNGPVFNSHNLGGWLAWTMYPGRACVSGQPAPGVSSGAFPRHPRRVAVAAGVGRAGVRRRLGRAVPASAKRTVGGWPISSGRLGDGL